MPSREQVMVGVASASVSWVKCSDSVALGVVIRSSERTPVSYTHLTLPTIA